MKHGCKIAHVGAGVLSGLLMSIAGAAPLNVADVPLFLPGVVPPLNMLVMSRDHRMFYEAYNDASDLNGNGILDIGYKPAEIDYYGYFESYPLLHVRERGLFTGHRGARQDLRRRHGMERRLAQLHDDEPHRRDAQSALRRPALDRHGHGHRAAARVHSAGRA